MTNGLKLTYHEGTMAELVENSARLFPDKIAIEFMGRKTSYKALAAAIDTCAQNLVKLGVREGDIVAVAMPNMPQTVIFIYALNKIGAVFEMIHPLSSEDELLKYINHVSAKYMLVLNNLFPKVKKIMAQTGLQSLVVTGARDGLGFAKKIGYDLTAGRKDPKVPYGDKIIRFSELLKKTEEPALKPIENPKDKMAAILFSGGTTGRTKAVCLSNYSINAMAVQMNNFCNTKETDIMLSVMPMFHGNGLVVGIHSMLISGCKCIVIPRFTPELCARECLKHRCCYISGSPTLLEKIISSGIWDNQDLSFLKGVFSGADSLPLELENKIDAYLKAHNCPVPVVQGYGMTEGVVASTLNHQNHKKTGSIGIPFDDVKVKIVEPGTEKELPVGEVGEIIFSSVTNMMGYYNDPEETDKVLKKHSDGRTWVHSGDLGYIDAEGFLFFKGRIKRMIVSSGYNILPLELEEAIDKHPLVARSCVVGVKDDVRIEKVKAFIQLKNGTEKSDKLKEEIIEYCKEHIARYAIPREIEFVDSFPLTKIGKIDYKKLG